MSVTKALTTLSRNCAGSNSRVITSIRLAPPSERFRSSVPENDMGKINYNDKSYDFNEIREQLDPDLVQELEGKHNTDQDFFDTYLVRHHEKFNEQFKVR